MTTRPPLAEWRWIESFARHFAVNGVTPGMEEAAPSGSPGVG